MNVEAQRITVPPIRKSIRVRASRETAFEVFTLGMGRWWFKNHSLLKVPQKTVVVEPREGGRWFEIGEDGSEQMWGRVLDWSPPERLVLAWQITGDWAYDESFETSVEVRFTSDGDETIVDFEHRDLERFGARASQLRDDYKDGMDGGWAMLLDLYRQHIEEPA